MFEGLQKKWKVSGLRLFLILCTFAIGGSLTGYAGRKLLTLLTIEQSWLWILLYILLVTLLWPLAVLLVSIPFGQYRFFTGYLKKIGKRMGLVKGGKEVGRGSGVKSQESGVGSSDIIPPTSDIRPRVTHIAIFASGNGSNAQQIIDHFRHSAIAKVSLVVCNKPGAGVLSIAAAENIPLLLVEKERFFHGNAYLDELQQAGIDFIVLAGFLWKIPPALIRAYPAKIINIHPALLPAYGGKGMYGDKVHEAVIAAGDTESGISIHYVDELYDHGQLIFQEKCPVLPGDTPASLAEKIRVLEHRHYPTLIGQLLAGTQWG